MKPKGFWHAPANLCLVGQVQLPLCGGYAQKTTLVGTRASDDEDPKGKLVNH
ncbi:MAG: hypothetical protein ACNYPD_01105 [Candidatus Halichondribacter symbioticus]